MKIEIPKKIYIWSWISITIALAYLIGMFVWGVIALDSIISLLIAVIFASIIIFLWRYPMFWILRNFPKK